MSATSEDNKDVIDNNNNIEYDESDASIPDYLDANHALLSRVQAAMKRELVNRDNTLTLQLRDQLETLNKSKVSRESIGVELYSLQQQLAKRQIELEKIHSLTIQQQQQREETEIKLKEAINNYSIIQSQYAQTTKKRSIAQKELDNIKATVNSIEEYNNKVKSEISITRRVAYGTEESMKKQEKLKSEQDLTIDNLNNQILNIEQEIQLYDSQIENQKLETEKALKILNEASYEMGLISIEKKEYLERWRLAVLGMNSRDTAITQAKNMLNEQIESIRAIQQQISAYKIQIKSEQVENEKLTSFLSRIENEREFMQTQLDLIAETKQQLTTKYNYLRETIEKIDFELKQQRYEEKIIHNEYNQLLIQIEKQTKLKQEIDKEILDNINKQTTLEKGSANIYKLTQKLKLQINDQELNKNNIENEIARIRVDNLNTQAHNNELKLTLKAYDNELNEKDKLIEKYELEIRQRHDKIEKKQIYIARLNRKYEQIMSSQVEQESLGPLENTIKNLNREINNINKQMNIQQKQWIKTQTELVTITHNNENELQLLRELYAKQTIFKQKKRRIHNETIQQKNELNELNNNIKSMHHDMAKLNEFIHIQTKLQNELTNYNYNTEQDFMNKLKQLELNAIKTSSLIQNINAEKQELTNEIIEVEKQIMLWEKKIELEKETQAAIDPEYGQPEINAMKKEIHRMKLRLTQLLRTQQDMVAEMERTINKREFIALNNTNPNNKLNSSATIKKQIDTLKNELTQTSKAHRNTLNHINKQEEQNNIVQQELLNQQSTYNQLELKQIELNSKLSTLLFQKQMSFEATIINQKRAKRYENLIKAKKENTNNVTSDNSNEEKQNDSSKRSRLEDELQKVDENFLLIRDVVQKMAQLNQNQNNNSNDNNVDINNNPMNKYSSWFKQLLSYM